MSKQERFLSRKIKQDSKGLFVHYGGIRFRPQKKTKYVIGQNVAMLPHQLHDYTAQIFTDVRTYEVWRRR